MHRYELEDGRPRGRVRKFPAIEETPFSRRIPEREMKISRTEYALEWIRYGYMNMPGPGETMWWLLAHSPHIIIVGSLAVGAADSTFELGIAEKMAEVKVDETAGPLQQIVQEIVHEIGVEAVEIQK